MKMKKINRRNFLKNAGIGSLAAMGAGVIPSETLSAIDNTEPMKITKVEAVKFRSDFKIEDRKLNQAFSFTPFTWLFLHTNTGIVGIGETYFSSESEIGALKDYSRFLIGKDPRDIETIWFNMYHRASHTVTGGAEMRIISAANIALWDILGKALGVPLYRLLGGKFQKLRVYNTTPDGLRVNNMTASKDVEKISRFLLDRGVKAIKLILFREMEIKNKHSYISHVEIDQCLDQVRRIRDTVGYEMEIGLEFHSRWNLPSAIRIAKSLEPYDILFLEDMLLPDNAQSYAVLARETSIPIMASERKATRYQYREMIESKAVDLVMWDATWCGGISEAKKISNLADTYFLPVVAHTNGGPVLWFASIHVLSSITNFYFMESVYVKYSTLYPYFVKNVPVPVDGFVTAPESPGLGIELREEPFKNGEAIVEIIAEA